MIDNHRSTERVLITGGLGFIGSNLAVHYLKQGAEVVAFDNFSRHGADANAAWLADQSRDGLSIVVGDVRNFDSVREAMHGCRVVIHLASQTTGIGSLDDPRQDFQVNALGGLNVLEAARASGSDPMVIYLSSSTVYGSLSGLELIEHEKRNAFRHRPEGIPESFPIDPHTPHACSKGAIDQYMLDYARTYGLKTVVFRASDIYGPRQLGTADQGWLAHFVISALTGRPATIYGDGRQARDLLSVHDLIEAIDRAVDRIAVCQGQVYNIGGGPGNASSPLEAIDRITAELGLRVEPHFQNWRPGDPKAYVSDVRKAERELGWVPRIELSSGLAELHGWVSEHLELFDAAETTNRQGEAAPQSSQATVRAARPASPRAVPLQRLEQAESAARRLNEITGSMKDVA